MTMCDMAILLNVFTYYGHNGSRSWIDHVLCSLTVDDNGRNIEVMKTIYALITDSYR